MEANCYHRKIITVNPEETVVLPINQVYSANKAWNNVSVRVYGLKNIKNNSSNNVQGCRLCFILQKCKCKCKKNVNVICLPTEHQGVHRTRSEMSVHSRIELEFEKCWFLRRGENRSTRRKTSRSREENQQQTQPTYDAGSVNWTRDIGGRRALSPLRHPCSPFYYNILYFMFKLNYPSCNKEEIVIVIYQPVYFFPMSAYCIWLQLDISAYKKFVFPRQAAQWFHWTLGVSILMGNYGLRYLT